MGALFLMRKSSKSCRCESQEECVWWGWEVLSEQLSWGCFRGCFRITPLGKLLSWESSCVVQGHTEISYPRNKLLNLSALSLRPPGRLTRALPRLVGKAAVRTSPLREDRQ